MNNSPKYNHSVPLKKKFPPSYWKDHMMNFSDVTTTEPFDPSFSIDEPSNKNLAIGETSNNQNQPVYDFAFFVTPVKVLKNALMALSDKQFNPGQNAVIQVGREGCEFTVSTLNINTDIPDFGYLCLRKSGLGEFQCDNPIEKALSLSGIPNIIQSTSGVPDNSVFVYSVQGSNKLSFRWCNGHLGRPHINTIDLEDVDPATEKFPYYISYGFKAVFPSSIFRDMYVKLHNKQPMPRPDTAEVILQQLISSDNVVTSSIEDRAKENEVWKEWRCWKSLQSASRTFNKASVYLVTRPTTGNMVRFEYRNLGDLVYLNPAIFKSVGEQPFLGQFHRLFQS